MPSLPRSDITTSRLSLGLDIYQAVIGLLTLYATVLSAILWLRRRQESSKPNERAYELDVMRNDVCQIFVTSFHVVGQD